MKQSTSWTKAMAVLQCKRRWQILLQGMMTRVGIEDLLLTGNTGVKFDTCLHIGLHSAHMGFTELI